MPLGNQRIEHAGQFGARVHETVRPQSTETLPEQGVAHLLAHLGVKFTDHQDQAPAAVPQRRMRSVDVSRRFFETPPPGWCQYVVGAAPDGFGAQPLIPGQTEDRSADQSFVEFERFEQPDQAAQPDASATRQDRVAEDGNDQGTGMYPTLLAEFIKTGLQGIAHGIGGRELAKRTTWQNGCHFTSSANGGRVSFYAAQNSGIPRFSIDLAQTRPAIDTKEIQILDIQ